MINSSRANLSLDLLSFFLQNDSLVFSSTSTFHLYISSVYFTVRRGDLLNLPKFYRASSVSLRAPTGKWWWLTDQSERAIYFCLICYNANCINTLGSYYSTCRPGYKGDGIICTGIIIKQLFHSSLLNIKIIPITKNWIS